MSPFLVSVVVKNPCANIDPDSWAWIFSGCWIFSQSPVWLPLFGSVTVALLLAVMLRSLRQESSAA